MFVSMNTRCSWLNNAQELLYTSPMPLNFKSHLRNHTADPCTQAQPKPQPSVNPNHESAGPADSKPWPPQQTLHNGDPSLDNPFPTTTRSCQRQAQQDRGVKTDHLEDIPLLSYQRKPRGTAAFPQPSEDTQRTQCSSRQGAPEHQQPLPRKASRVFWKPEPLRTATVSVKYAMACQQHCLKPAPSAVLLLLASNQCNSNVHACCMRPNAGCPPAKVCLA